MERERERQRCVLELRLGQRGYFDVRLFFHVRRPLLRLPPPNDRAQSSAVSVCCSDLASPVRHSEFKYSSISTGLPERTVSRIISSAIKPRREVTNCFSFSVSASPSSMV